MEQPLRGNGHGRRLTHPRSGNSKPAPAASRRFKVKSTTADRTAGTTGQDTTGGNQMVKLVYCITKKADLSDEEFFRYWKNVHGPIGARIPRRRKLVQSRRINIPGDKYPPAYDGIAELWFDNIEDLLAARQSPEWQAATEDEANFIDHTKVAYFVTGEHVVLT
jgi:uncharacterized protein (TIGR02118 family)